MLLVKKLFKNILFDTIIFIALVVLVIFILSKYDYILLNWCIYAIALLSFWGIICGTLQLLRRKKWLCITICVLELIILIPSGSLFCFASSCSKQKLVIVNNKIMVEDAFSFLLGNSVTYYDFINPFYIKNQPKIFEGHNNYLGDYLYTVYYDDKGNVIKKDKNQISDY